tara:strand:- start:771 stop:953 length:183 start_codon:yes stop_codon:yes gene_type:complete
MARSGAGVNNKKPSPAGEDLNICNKMLHLRPTLAPARSSTNMLDAGRAPLTIWISPLSMS